MRPPGEPPSPGHRGTDGRSPDLWLPRTCRDGVDPNVVPPCPCHGPHLALRGCATAQSQHEPPACTGNSRSTGCVHAHVCPVPGMVLAHSSTSAEPRRPTVNSKVSFKSRRSLQGRKRSSSSRDGGDHAFTTITSLPSWRSAGGAPSAPFSIGRQIPARGPDAGRASRGPRPRLATP